MFLKQSTAVTVKVGPFVDSTDGNTQETALTIAQADIRLSKNGGAFAQTNNATGATHDAAGWYGVPLDTTDTGTLGKLELSIHEAGALAVWRTFMVVPANVWDSLFGADKLQVHADEITAGLITATAIAADAITAAKVAADVHAEAADAVWDEAQSGHTTAGTFGETATEIAAILVDTGTTLDGKINTIDTNVDAILVDTAEIGAAGAGLTALATQASVNTIDSNVDAILVDTAEIGAAGAGLTALATAANLATVDTVVDAIKAKTDSLTFTVAGQADANIQSINDVTVAGDGSATPWGP